MNRDERAIQDVPINRNRSNEGARAVVNKWAMVTRNGVKGD